MRLSSSITVVRLIPSRSVLGKRRYRRGAPALRKTHSDVRELWRDELAGMSIDDAIEQAEWPLRYEDPATQASTSHSGRNRANPFMCVSAPRSSSMISENRCWTASAS